jgi:hypothetical protein
MMEKNTMRGRSGGPGNSRLLILILVESAETIVEIFFQKWLRRRRNSDLAVHYSRVVPYRVVLSR